MVITLMLSCYSIGELNISSKLFAPQLHRLLELQCHNLDTLSIRTRIVANLPLYVVWGFEFDKQSKMPMERSCILLR